VAENKGSQGHPYTGTTGFYRGVSVFTWKRAMELGRVACGMWLAANASSPQQRPSTKPVLTLATTANNALT
jgi:hypothetical protein